jgi:hypothetical protein
MPEFELGRVAAPTVQQMRQIFAMQSSQKSQRCVTKLAVSLLLASTLGTASVNALRADRAPDFVTAYPYARNKRHKKDCLDQLASESLLTAAKTVA